MRRIAVILFAAGMVFPVGLVAAPAAAAGEPYCASASGIESVSPPMPVHGDPTTVTPTFTGSGTVSGCVGLGVTSGTVSFTFNATNPQNCDTAQGGPGSGTVVTTWNNGETSTVDITNGSVLHGTIVSGLFDGATYTTTTAATPIGDCVATPVSQYNWFTTAPVVFAMPKTEADSCTVTQTCESAVAAGATTSAPGLTLVVRGTPSTGTGKVSLKIASGSLPCPDVATTTAPIGTLTDSGFKATDRLTVTASEPITSSTSPSQVCFGSTKPFKSRSSPTVPKPGPALLLPCTQVGNAAPCLLSSKQVGPDVVVKFVVPGGDPRFYIVPPKSGKGTQLWASQFPPAKKGRAYSARLQSRGGRAPVRWKVASGKLPKGCKLDADTGAITGTPTAKGSSTAVIQATDSATPPKTAKLTVPITVN